MLVPNSYQTLLRKKRGFSRKEDMDAHADKLVRKYEAVIILNPDVSETEQKNFFKRNHTEIQKFSGRVNHLDNWGKRRLANAINKFRLGNYFHTTFEAQGECVHELERLMKIDDRVLRYIHLRLDDRRPLSKYVEEYHRVLAEAHKREQEKEAKFQARKMAMSQGGGSGSRGPREVSYGKKPYEDDAGEES